jgi:glucokinase
MESWWEIIELIIKNWIIVVPVVGLLLFIAVVSVLFLIKWCVRNNIKSLQLLKIFSYMTSDIVGPDLKKEVSDLKQENECLKAKLAGQKVPIKVVDDPTPPSEGQSNQYFIGIDVGRRKVKYCIIDYLKFRADPFNKKVKLDEGEEPTRHPPDLYTQLCDILVKSNNVVKQEGGRVEGIGLGLPGQVEPKEGKIRQLPGVSKVGPNEPFVRFLTDKLRTGYSNVFGQNIPPVKIDNDVRCGTRCLLMKKGLKDAICIFVGNNTGSGIVHNGRIVYGHDFVAGEIGHMTMCWEGTDKLLGKQYPECGCGIKSHHWEMYASSTGMIATAKRLDPNKYKRIVDDYDNLIESTIYKKLLNNPFFGEHRDKHFAEAEGRQRELTSYFLSLAFYAGDPFVKEVVKWFFKLLAIGIANYIHVINPDTVCLGGGMIDGFFASTHPIDGHSVPLDTVKLLNDEVKEYVLMAAQGFHIEKLERDDAHSADIGAALIFKDPTYFDYINNKV